MIFSFNQWNTTVSEFPRESIMKVINDFTWMIEANKKKIRELNAWGEHARKTIQDLKNHVHRTLPNADPHIIVSWILNFETEPYSEYVKTESREWNTSLWNEIFAKEGERYENSLRDFLQNETFTTEFGTYNLELGGIQYEVGSTTPYQFSYTHRNTLSWKVKTHGHWDMFLLEEDVVGIQDFANDLRWEYFKRDILNVTKSHEQEYAKRMLGEYVPDNHIPCIQWISEILGE